MENIIPCRGTEEAKKIIVKRKVRGKTKRYSLNYEKINEAHSNPMMGENLTEDEKILNDETMKELSGETDDEYNERLQILDNKFILDACCGPKYMWFNKNHPNTLYIDNRKEEKGFLERRKNMEVNPDVVADFRELSFGDKKFKLIVWDPPHLLLGKTSLLRKQYGSLNKETWEEDYKQGFLELWKHLEEYGVLIFKFNDYDIPFKKVLALFPVQPLFGNTATNVKSKTKWFCFMKIPNDVKAHKEVKE